MNSITRDGAPSSTPLAGGRPVAAGVHRGVWIAGGLMAVTIVALAAALVVKNNDNDASTATSPVAAMAPATDATGSVGSTATAPATSTATAPVNESTVAPAPVVVAPPQPMHRVHQAPAPVAAAPAYDGGRQSVADEPPPAYAPAQVAAAHVCTGCGVIESFSTAQIQEAPNNGVGAVAGGAGGALLGSQIAGRGNHTLGGIIGAVGGGLLGNAIEHHERTVTVYDAHVRMNDGTIRTVRLSTPPRVGEPVTVEGRTLHARRVDNG